MTTRPDSVQIQTARTAGAAAIAVALAVGGVAAGAATAQPIDPAASTAAASAAANGLPGPVRRPPAAKPPPPLGTDPSTQPGLGQPVTPQLRIPLGRKPPPAVAGPGPRSTGDTAARCEAMRAEQMRVKCLDQLARDASRRN